METRARTSSDTRDLLAGFATIAAMLVVSGAAKSGYGVRGLGITALSCMLYQASKYVLAGIRALPLGKPSTRSLWPFRSGKQALGSAAPSASATMVPAHGP
jgi:hypothetical protein